MAASRSAAALTIHPSELSTYHRNPRRGDVSVIAASLQAHGQYKPIVVNRGTYTGRANEVLAGNHTLMAVRDLAEKHPDDERWQSVLVHWIDVDDDRAARIVLVDNRASEVGTFDHEALFEMVSGFADDLDGLGYSADDLADLEKLANEANPDFDSGDDVERGTGEKIALWGSTLGEPDIKPEPGSIWKMGHHTVVVMSVHLDWEKWTPLLSEGMLFAPYPSLMLPYVDTAVSTPMLMIQPDTYIAGWLLTKWNRLMPTQQAVCE